MFRFDAGGNFMAAYDFGWDSTPAIYSHSGTYSIVIKDNHYDAGAFCEPNPAVPVSKKVCVDAPKRPYFITQGNPSMNVKWQFKKTTTASHHNTEVEWCIKTPAIPPQLNGCVTSA